MVRADRGLIDPGDRSGQRRVAPGKQITTLDRHFFFGNHAASLQADAVGVNVVSERIQ